MSSLSVLFFPQVYHSPLEKLPYISETPKPMDKLGLDQVYNVLWYIKKIIWWIHVQSNKSRIVSKDIVS